MAKPQTAGSYVLGGADSAHDRLLRQGSAFCRSRKGFSWDAGLGPVQRVLDLGSGLGDVALLAARLVGPTGAVVGVDHDLTALAKARARAAEAGLRHLRFLQSDVSALQGEAPFDAVVGRFILMFLPDPVAVRRQLLTHARPGGVLVFQEASWPSFLPQVAHRPQWTACATLIGLVGAWVRQPG